MSESVRAAADGNGPSQEDFESCLSEFTELKTASQRLAQKIKTALGAYKAKGGDAEEIKFAHKMAKLDKGEAQAKVRRMNRAAVWAGIIEIEQDGQASFAATFGAPVVAKKGETRTSLKLSATRAKADGYNSGLAGSPIDASPFNGQPGSEEFVWWRDGWTQGHEDYLLNHPEAADVDTSRERPERDSGATHEPEVEQAMKGRKRSATTTPIGDAPQKKAGRPPKSGPAVH